ncbi:MAG: 30S ribosomal protein S7, partial [Bacilli bacterium]|nr:30S ribosomal protein S7 [Bacilli bacterium]
MPRKGNVEKRDVLPDPIYNSKLVTRLINRVMFDGKRGTAQTIIYHAFKKIEEKTGKPAMDVFATAVNNIMPEV